MEELRFVTLDELPPPMLLLLLPPPPSLTVLSASPAHRNFPYEHRFRRISRETPVTIVLTPASNVSSPPPCPLPSPKRGPNVVDGPAFLLSKTVSTVRIYGGRQIGGKFKSGESKERKVEGGEKEGAIGSFLLNERTSEGEASVRRKRPSI